MHVRDEDILRYSVSFIKYQGVLDSEADVRRTVNDPLPLPGRKSAHNLAPLYDSYQYCILINELQIKSAELDRCGGNYRPVFTHGLNPGFMSARFIKLIKV